MRYYLNHKYGHVIKKCYRSCISFVALNKTEWQLMAMTSFKSQINIQDKEVTS